MVLPIDLEGNTERRDQEDLASARPGFTFVLGIAGGVKPEKVPGTFLR